MRQSSCGIPQNFQQSQYFLAPTPHFHFLNSGKRLSINLISKCTEYSRSLCCNFCIQIYLILWLIKRTFIHFKDLERKVKACTLTLSFFSTTPGEANAVFSLSSADILTIKLLEQPDSTVEFRHYVRYHGHVFSHVPVEGEVWISRAWDNYHLWEDGRYINPIPSSGSHFGSGSMVNKRGCNILIIETRGEKNLAVVYFIDFL